MHSELSFLPIVCGGRNVLVHIFHFENHLIILAYRSVSDHDCSFHVAHYRNKNVCFFKGSLQYRIGSFFEQLFCKDADISI